MSMTRTAIVAFVLAAGVPVGLGPVGGAIAATAEPREERVDLRPKFRPGQQIRYTMDIDSSTAVTSDQMPELDQEQKLRQQITFVLRVVETGSDGSTIQMVYERVKVNVESEGFTASYDSAAPRPVKPGATPREKRKDDRRPRDADPANGEPGTGVPGGMPTLADMSDDELLAAAMEGIAGTVVTIDLDAAGNIKSVRGTESLSGGGVLPGLPGGGGMGLPVPSKGANGPWSISSPGQSGFARVGESWTTTSSLGNTPLGAFEMVTRYTLRSAAGGRAEIAISGGIEASSASSAPGSAGGAQVREARYNGRCIWDTNQGQLREMTTTQSATIEGSGLGVPMRMKSNTEVRVRRAG